MRRPICALHSRKNSATPQHIQPSTTGPPSCSAAVPMTAGGAMLMKVVGSRRSGHMPCVAMRANSSASSTGHSSTTMPNCAAAQAPAPRLVPASGASTLPTTGTISTGVSAGQLKAWVLSALSQRASTHSVTPNCASEPSHHSPTTHHSAPNSEAATVATRISDTGSVAMKPWRTGCFMSPATASG